MTATVVIFFLRPYKPILTTEAQRHRGGGCVDGRGFFGSLRPLADGCQARRRSRWSFSVSSVPLWCIAVRLQPLQQLLRLGLRGCLVAQRNDRIELLPRGCLVTRLDQRLRVVHPDLARIRRRGGSVAQDLDSSLGVALA